MPKLRKMLGSADHPTVQKLMRLIETQNKQTLAAWAVDYVGPTTCPSSPRMAATARPFPGQSRGCGPTLLAAFPLKSSSRC